MDDKGTKLDVKEAARWIRKLCGIPSAPTKALREMEIDFDEPDNKI